MANMTVHFKRPFRSDNLGEDVAIEEEVPLGLLLSVDWANNVRTTGTSFLVDNPIASWEVVSLKSTQLLISAAILVLNASYLL